MRLSQPESCSQRIDGLSSASDRTGPGTTIHRCCNAEYLRCYQDPATLHAMCEDYRAAATIDLEHDKADLGTKVQCPLLVIWGAQGAMDPLYDVLATWRERASDVRGRSLPGGHWLPEQLPDELTAELLPFLS